MKWGVVINHKNLQKHSAYILQNMELPGFDKEQQRLLTTIIHHQFNHFKMPDIGKFARYPRADIIALVRLLRLAILLNKSRQATSKTNNITLKIDRTLKKWSLYFDAEYLEHNPLVKNELMEEQKRLSEFNLALDFYS